MSVTKAECVSMLADAKSAGHKMAASAASTPLDDLGEAMRQAIKRIEDAGISWYGKIIAIVTIMLGSGTIQEKFDAIAALFGLSPTPLIM